MRRLNPLWAVLIMFASAMVPIALSFAAGSWCFKNATDASGCDAFAFIAIPFIVLGLFGGLLLFYLTFFLRVIYRKQRVLGLSTRAYALVVLARFCAVAIPAVVLLEQYSPGALFGETLLSYLPGLFIFWFGSLLYLNKKKAL
ncbi:MAG: hypothetical protein V4674_02215 [Patescibacteria group bacterium]